ncbi:MAG TPA: M23 family metallopeptidase [Rhodospirillaceae bacterium]|nr:M23 family metallopeptidase [Rhodospirillaceae bacterium]
MELGKGEILADRPSVFRRVIAHRFETLKRVFPERQILVRDAGKVRCFKIGTVQQLLVTGAVTACVLWALLSTAAYFDGAAQLMSKEDEISQRAAELEGLRASYQAAFGRLDEFQSVFANITCEISDIQDSLLRITEHNVATKHGAMPRLDPDPSGCRSAGSGPSGLKIGTGGGAVDTKRIIGSLKEENSGDSDLLRHRVTQLDEALDKLRASHGAFLQNTANLTALRIGELEKALSAVGVNTRNIPVETETRPVISHLPFGRGGPFIAANRGLLPLPNLEFDPIALFNNHANRLDSLTSALHNLPLAAPLADYEVTSPFGTRNDPINALTGIHEGVDLGAAVGTPVTATGAGEVTWAGWRDRYGLMVEIDHGMGFRSRYAHLSKAMVVLGHHVSRGAVIGLVGETGRTTGPHLHYEVRMSDQPTNPMKFITAGQNVLKTQ